MDVGYLIIKRMLSAAESEYITHAVCSVIVFFLLCNCQLTFPISWTRNVYFMIHDHKPLSVCFFKQVGIHVRYFDVAIVSTIY